MDYEKAFDSVELCAGEEALVKGRIDSRYKNLLKNVYSETTMTARLDGPYQSKGELDRGIPDCEIAMRTRLEWAAFDNLAYVLKNHKIPMHLRTKVFDQCIQLALIYETQTWTFTKAKP